MGGDDIKLGWLQHNQEPKVYLYILLQILALQSSNNT